jgi:hypothetical protein
MQARGGWQGARLELVQGRSSRTGVAGTRLAWSLTAAPGRCRVSLKRASSDGRALRRMPADVRRRQGRLGAAAQRLVQVGVE